MDVQDKKLGSSLGMDVLGGSLGGIAAAACVQPMLYFKNLCQRGIVPDRTHLAPLRWYRGGRSFCLSFPSTIALQSGCNRLFADVFYGPPLLASMVAGLSSSIVVAPAERLMILQQRSGQGLRETARQIVSRQGIQGLFRGLGYTAGRESLFTSAYLLGAPALKQKFRALGVTDTTAGLASGIIAGGLAALLSQPLDTAKTRVQASVEPIKLGLGTVLGRQACAGLGWRVAITATATTIIPLVQDVFVQTWGIFSSSWKAKA